MQTWVLTVLLVLSLFANGYLFAQRGASPPPPSPDAPLVSNLQSLMMSLDAEPEWRHRFVSLGRFSLTRDDRREAQQRLVSGELFAALVDPEPDYPAITALVEELSAQDTGYRLRLVEQLIVLLRDLEPSQRLMLLDRLRMLELSLDELVLLGQLLP